jgi:hypothetical protein
MNALRATVVPSCLRSVSFEKTSIRRRLFDTARPKPHKQVCGLIQYPCENAHLLVYPVCGNLNGKG